MRAIVGLAAAAFICITLGYLAALAFLLSLMVLAASVVYSAASKVGRGL